MGLNSRQFWAAILQAINATEAFPVAAALYSILRAGVRFWGLALPGQCTNTVINLSFSTGRCVPAAGWLLTRVSQDTSAHAWSWIMYGAFALMIALWDRPKIGEGLTSFALFWRNLEGSWTVEERLAVFNGWRAFLLVGFAIAVHELAWFFTYFVVHPQIPEIIINLEVYGSFIAMCGIGLVIFFLLGFQKYLDLRILGAGLLMVALFYAGWAQIGYPLTLDLVIGVTPIFGVPWVSFIEFASWLMIFTVVGMAYYAAMVRREGRPREFRIRAELQPEGRR